MKRPEIGPNTTMHMQARTTALIKTMKDENWTVKQSCFILLRAAAIIGWNGGLQAAHMAQMIPVFFVEFNKRKN